MPFLTKLTVDCLDDGYPFSIPAIRGLEEGIELHPKVTYLVGENGMGKSTLLEDFSQLVIATHSPIVLAYPDSIIYEFDEDGIRKTVYEETQAYQVTQRFMRDPRGMVGKLLGDG